MGWEWCVIILPGVLLAQSQAAPHSPLPGPPPAPRSGELSSGGQNAGVCRHGASRAGRSTPALATCTRCVCCRDEVTGLLPLWALASPTREGPVHSDILRACFRCWLYSQLIPALSQLPAFGCSRMELLKWNGPLSACLGTWDFYTRASTPHRKMRVEVISCQGYYKN